MSSITSGTSCRRSLRSLAVNTLICQICEARARALACRVRRSLRKSTGYPESFTCPHQPRARPPGAIPSPDSSPENRGKSLLPSLARRRIFNIRCRPQAGEELSSAFQIPRGFQPPIPCLLYSKPSGPRKLRAECYVPLNPCRSYSPSIRTPFRRPASPARIRNRRSPEPANSSRPSSPASSPPAPSPAG